MNIKGVLMLKNLVSFNRSQDKQALKIMQLGGEMTKTSLSQLELNCIG